MTRILILIITLLSSLQSFSQDSLDTDWLLSIDIGIQEHDKRLYDFPPKEHLLASQPEILGTYQFGISVSRHLLGKNKIKLFGGLGLSSELSTFLRPFDHWYGEEFGTNVLLYTDKYYKFIVQSPIKLNYMFSDRFGISMDILPQFDFLTDARNTIQVTYNYKHVWWGFNLYSLELNPGLIYTSKFLDFGLKYRVFQIKKIDRIIFNRIVGDPRTDQIFETENPFKIWLSIGRYF